MSAPAAPAAAKRGGRKLILAVVCLVCLGGGAAVPLLVSVPPIFAKGKAEKKPNGPPKTAIVPFGEVVVNLTEERMNRYLRLKLALLTDADGEKDVTDRLTKQKAAVKSRLIGYLSGKTLKDVSGTVGVNRLQREALEKIDDVLYPDGESKIRDVLFEEYVVQ
ncbi:MAG TPA: flagellar basal body-associated FliL family protein [Urbifossiella sp.]|jgi:flagellar basal body-associated protein FliL|nr:flagellar basal body-associated FliL family protein [Urbifossiella sp.]